MKRQIKTDETLKSGPFGDDRPDPATGSRTEPPVQLLSQEIVRSNPVWTVCANHIREESGLEVRGYITVRSSTGDRRADLITGVSVIAERGGDLVLNRFYRFAAARYVWELPRGFVDPGEEPWQAALRELGEETGLTCQPEDLVPLGREFPDPSIIEGQGAIFLARNCQAGATPVEDEVGRGEAVFLPRETVFAMLDRFEIEDAGSALGLHRYRDWLMRQVRE